MAKRICQRCHQLVERGHSCRGSAHQRGYDQQWAKFRTWFLTKKRWKCHDCGYVGGPGRKPSMHVHHIEKLAEYPELRLHESNCLPLCEICHDKRTAKGE